MVMQLVIEYPKILPDALQQTRASFEQEARMAMAVKMFEMKRLSSGTGWSGQGLVPAESASL